MAVPWLPQLLVKTGREAPCSNHGPEPRPSPPAQDSCACWVVQPTPFCNLDLRATAYLPQPPTTPSLPLELLERTLERVPGEPLMVGRFHPALACR